MEESIDFFRLLTVVTLAASRAGLVIPESTRSFGFQTKKTYATAPFLVLAEETVFGSQMFVREDSLSDGEKREIKLAFLINYDPAFGCQFSPRLLRENYAIELHHRMIHLFKEFCHATAELPEKVSAFALSNAASFYLSHEDLDLPRLTELWLATHLLERWQKHQREPANEILLTPEGKRKLESTAYF